MDYPIAHLAGWYDIFSSVQLSDALNIDATGGLHARGAQVLVVEPGGHCGGGAIQWPNSTWGMDLLGNYQLQMYSETIGPPFAVSHNPHSGTAASASYVIEQLRDEARSNGGTGSVVIWYLLGSGGAGDLGNFWAGGGVAEFSNTTELTLFLHAGGKLNGDTPTAGEKGTATSWKADPSRPLPTIGGNTLTLPICGPQNQRGVEANFSTGQALFETAPFEEGLLLHGWVKARFWVASDAADTDITVKLTDVWPTGESMLIQDGIVRLRWRLNWPLAEQPAPPLAKNTPVEVEVEVAPMSYVFSPGHVLRLSVASSNWPRFDVNPNTGAPLSANDTHTFVATNSVLHDAAHPSSLSIPILNTAMLEHLRL